MPICTELVNPNPLPPDAEVTLFKIEGVVFGQILWSSLIVPPFNDALTVTVILKGVPLQPFVVGVTV